MKMESTFLSRALEKVKDLELEIQNILNEAITDSTPVKPEELGLDRRSAQNLWVCDEGIFVREISDRSLQYYGGFEYVPKDLRHDYGDYIFYSAVDERVWEHIDRFMSNSADKTENE